MDNRLLSSPISALTIAAILASCCWAIRRAQAAGQEALPALGVATMQQKTACFSIDRAKLPAGEPVSLVVLGTPQSIVSARIAGPGTNCSQETGFTNYKLRVTNGTLPDTAVSIGAVTSTSQVQLYGGTASLSVSGQQPLLFRNCTSSDGFHVTAWHGAALTGTLAWHRYIYLNQDLEPTCSDKETQDVAGSHG